MVTQDSPVECSRRVFLDLFQFLVATGYIALTSASILTQASLPSTLLSLLQTLEVLLSTKPPFPNNVTSTPSAWSWGVLGGEGSTFKPLHGPSCSPKWRERFKACSCYCHQKVLDSEVPNVSRGNRLWSS